MNLVIHVVEKKDVSIDNCDCDECVKNEKQIVAKGGNVCKCAICSRFKSIFSGKIWIMWVPVVLRSFVIVLHLQLTIRHTGY